MRFLTDEGKLSLDGRDRIIKLDIGCNIRKHNGYIGLDLFPCEGVDIVIDLEKENLPYTNENIDEIIMHHTLEHLANAWEFMFEICRVLKVGGNVQIKVPFYTCVTAHDLGHKTFINPFSMGYWTKGGSTSPNNPAFLKFTSPPRIKFNYFKDWRDIPLKPFEWFANTFPKLYVFGFAYIIPAFELEFNLEKIKDYDWKFTA